MNKMTLLLILAGLLFAGSIEVKDADNRIPVTVAEIAAYQGR